MNEIICAFSGLAPKEEEYVESTDELSDTPVGWSKVTIQTRIENQEWAMLQVVKAAMVQQLETQIDDEVSEEEKSIAQMSIRMQVEAQFAALEDRIPQHLIEERTTYISDPTKDKDIKEMFDKLIEDLDLKDENASI